MKILKKRPLALILCIMLGGFSFFAGYGWQIQLIASSLALSIIAIIFIFDNLLIYISSGADRNVCAFLLIHCILIHFCCLFCCYYYARFIQYKVFELPSVFFWPFSTLSSCLLYFKIRCFRFILHFPCSILTISHFFRDP